MEHCHSAHRERMKQRFLKNGFRGMAEHEILELALFFSIPYKDTNALAHTLIQEFGSIRRLLKASPDALRKVKGIGEHTVVFLHFLRAFLDYENALPPDQPPTLLDSRDAEEYVCRRLRNQPVERFMLFCLDGKLRLIGEDLISEGTVNRAYVNTRRLVELALKHNAQAAILAHNHPEGHAVPSESDHSVTRKLYFAFHFMGVKLMDHIIVSDEDSFSYYRSGALDAIVDDLPCKQPEDLRFSNPGPSSFSDDAKD